MSPVSDMYGYGLFERTDLQVDKEIFYSYNHNVIKKGGFAAVRPTAGPDGDGILVAGTVMAIWSTADADEGLWVPYADGTAGANVAAGILAKGVDVSARREAINILFAGWFKTAALVGLDAAAITDLAARQNAQYGWTKIG